MHTLMAPIATHESSRTVPGLNAVKATLRCHAFEEGTGQPPGSARRLHTESNHACQVSTKTEPREFSSSSFT